MDRLFGKPKEKAPRPTLQDASATMEARGERQDDRIMKLDKELARYTQQLKTMKPGPAKQQVQKRAMAILKQKKMYENQREQTRNQQFNMDQVMFAQESLAETANTVSAMKDANKALKKQFKAIDINQVEDMQDDMADLLEQAEEIQSAMGRSYNTDDIDEARHTSRVDYASPACAHVHPSYTNMHKLRTAPPLPRRTWKRSSLRWRTTRRSSSPRRARATGWALRTTLSYPPQAPSPSRPLPTHRLPCPPPPRSASATALPAASPLLSGRMCRGTRTFFPPSWPAPGVPPRSDYFMSCVVHVLSSRTLRATACDLIS